MTLHPPKSLRMTSTLGRVVSESVKWALNQLRGTKISTIYTLQWFCCGVRLMVELSQLESSPDSSQIFLLLLVIYYRVTKVLEDKLSIQGQCDNHSGP